MTDIYIYYYIYIIIYTHPKSLVRNREPRSQQLNLNNKYFNDVNGHIRVSTLVIMNLLI